MKLKNLAFFGVMGAILSVAAAQAAPVATTDYLTTKGYVDARDTATLNAAVDAAAEAASDALTTALADYSTTSEMNTAISTATNDMETQTHASSTYATQNALTTGLAGKQDTIDSTHKLSGTLISDGTVGTDQLSTGVNTSLGKANSAVQTVETGTANGTIKVDGTAVSVYGLGSAAYTESTAYDRAGAANDAKDAAIAAAATGAFDASENYDADTIGAAIKGKQDTITTGSLSGTMLTDGTVSEDKLDTATKGKINSALTSSDLSGYATETYVGTQIAGLDGSVSATDNKVVTGVTTTDGVVTAVSSTLIANANVSDSAAIAPSKLNLGTCAEGRDCILTYGANGYVATPITKEGVDYTSGS